MRLKALETPSGDPPTSPPRQRPLRAHRCSRHRSPPYGPPSSSQTRLASRPLRATGPTRPFLAGCARPRQAFLSSLTSSRRAPGPLPPASCLQRCRHLPESIQSNRMKGTASTRQGTILSTRASKRPPQPSATKRVGISYSRVSLCRKSHLRPQLAMALVGTRDRPSMARPWAMHGHTRQGGERRKREKRERRGRGTNRTGGAIRTRVACLVEEVEEGLEVRLRLLRQRHLARARR